MKIKLDKKALQGLGNNLPDGIDLEVNPDDSESKQLSDIQKQFKKAGLSISRSGARSYLKQLKKGK